MKNKTIIVVLGLPRSGTTATMQMLQAGGVEIYADNHISFETNEIYKLPKDWKWLKKCEGKSIKLLEPLIYSVPQKFNYKFIQLRRNIHQQALSYHKFMNFLNINTKHENYLEILEKTLYRDTINIWNKYSFYPNSKITVIDFENLIDQPLQVAKQLKEFIDEPLNTAAMAQTIIQRSSDCLPYLLEAQKLYDQPKQT